MNRSYLKRVAVALVVLNMASTAFAQYVWLNEKGIKQYSDQPPPATVPQSRILKTPSGGASRPSSTEAAAASQTGAPLSSAEKNADFVKRRTEQAEKDKKAAEDAKLASAKAKNCERAREYQRTLESGQRIANTDGNGERHYLSDEQRTREVRDTQRVLDDCR
jgi:hypothetical protein